jgi:hypothetical protein
MDVGDGSGRVSGLLSRVTSISRRGQVGPPCCFSLGLVGARTLGHKQQGEISYLTLIGNKKNVNFLPGRKRSR